MNIFEAVNSGRDYKRPYMDAFILAKTEKLGLSLDDLKAEDWLVRDKAVKLTEAELLKAFKDLGDTDLKKGIKYEDLKAYLSL